MKKNRLIYLIPVGLFCLSSCNKELGEAIAVPASNNLTTAADALPQEKTNATSAKVTADDIGKLSNHLMIATLANNLEKVKETLKQGADVNFIYKNANRIIEITDYSLENCPNGEDLFCYRGKELNKPWTALMLACAQGQADIVTLLLSEGANTEIKAPDNGDTALIIATKKDDTNIVKLLLEHGAKVDNKNKEGFSPLALAVEGNNSEIVKLLLEKRANVNTVNAWQETPLMMASVRGFTDMAKLLLDNGANPNLQSDVGATALLLATNQNQPEVVKLLLEHKADVHLANQAGYTPLRVALEDHNTKIIKLLKNSGARK